MALTLARIELWNGDICELEVDAIVNPANLSLWMATGVGGAIKRAGGDEIEFAAVRQAPVELGESIVTPAGTLAARAVIHAVSLDRVRRTSGPGHRAGGPQRDGPCPGDGSHGASRSRPSAPASVGSRSRRLRG